MSLNITSVLIFLLLTCAATAQTNSYNFEDIMSVPLERCAVVLYTHEIIEVDGERRVESDHTLAKETINCLVNIKVPIQFWTLGRGQRESARTLLLTREKIHEGLYKNPKITCTTSLWFLKPRISSLYRTQTIEALPWVLFGKRTEHTDHDYTILGFMDGKRYGLEIDLTYPRDPGLRLPHSVAIPGNLIFTRMSLSASHGEKKFRVQAVGGLRYFCTSKRYFCVDWYKATDLVSEFWRTPEDFHKTLALLSSYISGSFYNFNKAPVHIESTFTQPKYWNMARELDHRKGLFPPYSYDQATNRRLYGSHSLDVIHGIKRYLEIFENIFNATVWVLTKQNTSLLYREILRFPTVKMGGLSAAKPIRSDRTIYDGFHRIGFYCFDFQSTNVQFHVLFHPMDRWTWASLVGVAGALVLMFWKHSKHPVFNLVILFFAQGDVDEVKKFKILLVLWSCLGLLLTAGYSSFISSLLIVPKNINHPRNFKEIYEQGYKLALREGFTVKDKGLHSYFRRDILEDPKFIGRNRHLIKLGEETIILPQPIKSSRLLIHDYIENYGKFCQSVAPEIFAETSCENYLEKYDDIICFTHKEALTVNPYKYEFSRTGAEVLRRGVQVLFAVGLMQFWQHYYHISCRVIAETRGSHCYKEQACENDYRYFSKLPRDEKPYLFTLRNVQGKMIFYFGAICAGMSLSGLLYEFGVMRRCRQTTIASLKSVLKCAY